MRRIHADCPRSAGCRLFKCQAQHRRCALTLANHCEHTPMRPRALVFRCVIFTTRVYPLPRLRWERAVRGPAEFMAVSGSRARESCQHRRSPIGLSRCAAERHVLADPRVLQLAEAGCPRGRRQAGLGLPLRRPGATAWCVFGGQGLVGVSLGAVFRRESLKSKGNGRNQDQLER
jgi:hypothetical protein